MLVYSRIMFSLWCCPEILFLLSFLLVSPVKGYDLVRDYSGTTFFDGWNFFGGWDNLTLGDTWWLNATDAFAQRLAYVDASGNAVIRVDNISYVPFNQKRNSVRITTRDAYAVGSLWIFDIKHLPFGCSVWPAIWSFGPNWPYDGEIDIMEGINLQLNNQMALHTTPGCGQQPNPIQKGQTLQGDCSTPEGCTVVETAMNSFQSGFAATGGGVWAAQFDISGIFIWFWSRPDVPPSISFSTSTSSIDVSQWGPPSAAFPSTTCNIPQFFSPQNLVIDITLCGNWAGIPQVYAETCQTGPTGNCYADNVVGSGSKFNDAYFEISYVRAYTTGGVVPTTSPAINAHSSATPVPNVTTTITAATTTQTASYLATSREGPDETSSAPAPDTQTGTSGSVKTEASWVFVWTIVMALMI